jgi:hypothetical protein
LDVGAGERKGSAPSESGSGRESGGSNAIATSRKSGVFTLKSSFFAALLMALLASGAANAMVPNNVVWGVSDPSAFEAARPATGALANQRAVPLPLPFLGTALAGNVAFERPGTVDIPPLIAGAQKLLVNGAAVAVSRLATGLHGDDRGPAVEMTATTPVPPSEIIATILAGLGAIGFLAFRRRRD